MAVLQFTLTVEEGKELISRGVLKHPLFQQASSNGKILLKGGTTVSRISEKVIGQPLRICGRVTARGTVSNGKDSKKPHSVLIEGGSFANIDNNIIEISEKLGTEDLVICGANAIDNNGQAALMAGSPGGGNVGKAVSSWFCEGVNVLITAGLEKIIPGDLRKIANKTGRRIAETSWGMSVGLILLPGTIFNEISAVETLVDIECYPLGAGGLGDAAGSIILEATGNREEIGKLFEIIKEIKTIEKRISGISETLIECRAVSNRCKHHLGCGYKKGVLSEDE